MPEKIKPVNEVSNFGICEISILLTLSVIWTSMCAWVNLCDTKTLNSNYRFWKRTSLVKSDQFSSFPGLKLTPAKKFSVTFSPE